jgi:hypothetical protein
MFNILNHAIFVDVNVQPLRLVVSGAHRTGLDDAVLLGKVGLCKRL